MTNKITRTVIQIDENKCIGCGICANVCHMSVIEIIDGKAKVVGESRCDGLGVCMPKCPTNAISFMEKEIEQEIKQETPKPIKPLACGCPGTMAKSIKRDNIPTNNNEFGVNTSALGQWPVQISLLSPNAPYFNNADLLISGDCCAYAYGNFHQDFMKNKVVLVGCPKLDDIESYTKKFTDIFANNNINSITVTRMEVPCCTGILNSVKEALVAANKNIPLTDIVIGTSGDLIKK